MTKEEFEEKKAYIENHYRGSTRDVQLKKIMAEYSGSLVVGAAKGILNLFKTNNGEEANSKKEKVKQEKSSQDAKYYLDLARQSVIKGDHTDAIRRLTLSLESDPNYVQTYIDRSFSYNEIGEYKLAMEDINTALKLDPNNETAYCYRGLIYLATVDYEHAFMDFSTAQKLDPKNISGVYHTFMFYEEWSKKYIENSEFDRAIAEIESWLKFDITPEIQAYLKEKIDELNKLKGE
jgi:Tfp pilus assembly protein PilF